MFREDRVLVAVINRKRDFEQLRDAGWYRIPQKQMPKGVHAEYMAFFLSRAFKERNGGIHYYAEVKGVELAYRKDLLPDEREHKRADEVYYKIMLGELKQKSPPVLNPAKRSVSFIFTTWDRFVQAEQISDLYRDDPQFVDRAYYALRDGDNATRAAWDAIDADPEKRPDLLRERPRYYDPVIEQILAENPDPTFREIVERIMSEPGPVMMRIPLERGW